MIYVARSLFLISGFSFFASIMILIGLLKGHAELLTFLDKPLHWGLGLFAAALAMSLISKALGNDLADESPLKVKRKSARRKTTPVSEMSRSEYNDFISNAYLAGDSKISFEDFSAANFGQLRAHTQDAAKQARNAAIDGLKLDANPCRLEIMVPPGPSDSWVGGCPSLPRDMMWPEIDGKPAMFFAQIAAHSLPPDIWGGLGPRNGWLLIFASGQEHGPAKVIHTTEIGEERRLPIGMVYDPHYYGTYNKRAIQMMGDAGLQPPRWPVQVVPTDRDASPSNARSLRAVIGDLDFNNPVWHPFDWRTTTALIESVLASTEKLLNPNFPSANDPRWLIGQEAIKASIHAMLPDLHALSEHVRKLSAETPFMAPLRDQIMNSLRGLRIQGWSYEDGKASGPRLLPLLQPQRVKDYGDMFELRARHLYAQGSNALPPAVISKFEPYWKDIAASEVITIGGSGDKFEKHGVANMLELVPSALFGWGFGDFSNFACLIKDDDIFDGHLDRAFCIDNHGL